MARGGKRQGSGRPSGSRSAANKDQIANLSDLAKTHAQSAIDALVSIATGGESEAARVSAANAILDRAYGKPQQSVELSNPDGSLAPKHIDPSKLSTEALRELTGALHDQAPDANTG